MAYPACGSPLWTLNLVLRCRAHPDGLPVKANKVHPPLPLPAWIAIAWWAFSVMSALVAMLLLLLYDGWIVHNGYHGWYILAWGEGEVSSAPWRKLWWWILLSYAALIGGIAGTMFIQQVLSRQ